MRTELLTEIAPENALLSRLRPMARQASAAVVGVAFVQRAGMKHLFSALRGQLEAQHPVEVFTSGYLGITEPEALEDLLKLSRQYSSLTVRFNVGDRFHAKFIVLIRPARAYCLFVGSSNISVAGLAGLGELNIQIVGTVRDSVGRSIAIVVDNLRRDRTFRPLNRDLIKEYRQTLPGRRKRRRRPLRDDGGGGKLPSLESMPIYVERSEFTKSQVARVLKTHPRWSWFVDWMVPLRALDRGQHFVEIDATRRNKTFTIAKYLANDKVSDVGVIAHVRRGKSFPLAKLVERLEVTQRSLLKERMLDVYGVAIVRRVFPKAFG